jgi:D-alanine-D-alanine ligase
MRKRIAVVTGGYSGESVISFKSADMVLKAIDTQKYEPVKVVIEPSKWYALYNQSEYAIDKNDFSFTTPDGKMRFDGVFMALHGTPGEDGKLQAYFDMLGIKYNNSGVLTSSLTFNKALCNNLLRHFNFNCAPSILLYKNDGYNKEEIIKKLGLPCFVKPNNGGSSIGISKVETATDLDAAIEKAFKEDKEIIIESYINGVEVTCGTRSAKGNAEAIAITEIVSNNSFFDFEAKYNDAATQEITPARISKEMYTLIMKETERVYTVLKCKGFIRIDFIIQNNVPYLIEVNTVPGMSERSILPQQAAFAGISVSDLYNAEIDMMF